MSSLDQARALLQGSYDLHIHPIPSHVPRLLDDFEVLAQAEEAGMAGVLLKNHYEPTGPGPFWPTDGGRASGLKPTVRPFSTGPWAA